MPVMKVRAGTVFHVVHETLTHTRRKTGFSICHADNEFDVTEMRAGVPTCTKCLELDNPLNLSAHERNLLHALALGPRAANGPALGPLVRRDLIAQASGGCYTLTRRGRILAQDFTDGTAPWVDAHHVGHLRHPLQVHLLCGMGGMGAEVAALTLDRYDKLRKLGTVVTCIACLHGLTR